VRLDFLLKQGGVKTSVAYLVFLVDEYEQFANERLIPSSDKTCPALTGGTRLTRGGSYWQTARIRQPEGPDTSKYLKDYNCNRQILFIYYT